MIFQDKTRMVEPDQALPGRGQAMPVDKAHFVSQHPIQAPFPEGFDTLVFGMGCFWGAEKKFWSLPGVYSTAVGYAAGFTPNPTYQEVCSGKTGHNEVVLVVYDPAVVSTEQLISLFFESHNPTQGMRQGNDQGTQYRSGIYYTSDAQKSRAEKILAHYQAALTDAKYGQISSEVLPLGDFYYAESYHQQYLAKNPNGYCGLGGTGVTCGT